MKKRIIEVILVLIVGCIIFRHIQILPYPIGGGQYLESPNKKYEAHASNLIDKDFWGNTKNYYELKIFEKPNITDAIKTIIIEPRKSEEIFDARSDQKIIKYAEDSSEVEFSFNGMNLTIKLSP